MEATKDRTKCQYAERDIYQKHQRNPYAYATEICKWTVQRKLELLQIRFQSMANTDPKKMATRAEIDHYKSRKAVIIQQVFKKLSFLLQYPLYPCTQKQCNIVYTESI